ncbi:hypothetical protein ACIP5Y_47375 [Nocardia sp. NPDC088792]|uniref:hypothetical protein n=1 Tax=Nocardia sp. NPDC088792 TaxID=3364332 RepID=UPI0037FAEB4C
MFVLVLAIAGALLVLGLGLDAYNWLSPGDPVVRSWGIDWNIVGAWVAVALLPVQVLPLAVGAFVLQVLAVFLLARPALRAWLAPSPALTR